MASLNTSHHQDGGVLLYNGELVLLYCDKVNCEIDNVGNASGRMFLTTHRIVFTAQPINQNPRLQSLSAPFYAMFDLGLEQPIFGANYIRGKVRTSSEQNTSALTQNQYSFKLKFNKGGAIEFGRAMTMAAKQASQIASETGFNNYSFTTSSADQYYQAPSGIYQPDYPVGFVLPNQVFNQVPANGTIYYQTAPPPYPGFVATHQTQPQSFAQVYPTVSNSVYEANMYSQMLNNPYNPQFTQANQYPPNQNIGMTNPPPYQPNNYPNYSSPNQSPYQPQSANTTNYTQQYPPLSGYAPQSNNTYPNVPNAPNIPSYEESTKKGK